MQIDGFIDKDEFKKQIDEWIRVFRNTKPTPGTSGPLIPGDPEREAEAIPSKEGIPLLNRWWLTYWRFRKSLGQCLTLAEAHDVSGQSVGI